MWYTIVIDGPQEGKLVKGSYPFRGGIMPGDGKPQSPTRVHFFFRRAESYRTIHATGAFGGMTPAGNVKFDLFTEYAATPKEQTWLLKEDGKLDAQIPDQQDTGVLYQERELQVGIVMSMQDAESLAQWLLGHVSTVKLQKAGGG